MVLDRTDLLTNRLVRLFIFVADSGRILEGSVVGGVWQFQSTAPAEWSHLHGTSGPRNWLRHLTAHVTAIAAVFERYIGVQVLPNRGNGYGVGPVADMVPQVSFTYTAALKVHSAVQYDFVSLSHPEAWELEAIAEGWWGFRAGA